MSMGMEISNVVATFLAFASNMMTMFSLAFISSKIAFEIVGIGDIVYSEKWYEYPKNVKIFILLIIQNTQRVRYLNGLQIIYCNLETFLKVNSKNLNCNNQKNFHLFFFTVNQNGRLVLLDVPRIVLRYFQKCNDTLSENNYAAHTPTTTI